MRTMLLQVLFSIRSKRQLVEQISFNQLCRWFVGLAIEDAVWICPMKSNKFIERHRTNEFSSCSILTMCHVLVETWKEELSGWKIWNS